MNSLLPGIILEHGIVDVDDYVNVDVDVNVIIHVYVIVNADVTELISSAIGWGHSLQATS